METFKVFIDEMNRNLKTADHLIYVTYPLVKDDKLIITALENLYNSLKNAIEAILFYDKLYKRISPYPENFSFKLEIFRMKCAPRYNFDREAVVLIQDIDELIEDYKESPMSFMRKDKYYIFNRDYKRMKHVDLPKIKYYISTAKSFIEKINRIYMQDVSRRRE